MPVAKAPGAMGDSRRNAPNEQGGAAGDEGRQLLLLHERRAAVISADVPVAVQFTRVDTRRAALAVATTLALPLD